ncbi:MAG: hypothetical protein QXS54_08170, partial [Candidatus Methanomethylicaceae archaeon]
RLFTGRRHARKLVRCPQREDVKKAYSLTADQHRRRRGDTQQGGQKPTEAMLKGRVALRSTPATHYACATGATP